MLFLLQAGRKVFDEEELRFVGEGEYSAESALILYIKPPNFGAQYSMLSDDGVSIPAVLLVSTLMEKIGVLGVRCLQCIGDLLSLRVESLDSSSEFSILDCSGDIDFVLHSSSKLPLRGACIVYPISTEFFD
jgi:hypothetical protein